MEFLEEATMWYQSEIEIYGLTVDLRSQEGVIS